MSRAGLRALAIVACVALACGEADYAAPSGGGESSAVPDQETWGITKRVTESGRLKATIVAEHMARYDRKQESHLDGDLRVTFFDANQREASQLTAKSARIDEESRVLTAVGEVVLIARDSTRLETDTLRWAETSELVTGGGPVTIHRAEGTERGIGFEATSDLKTWTLLEVVTRLAPADSAGEASP